MPITLQDIAKAADVSVSTVSRVLSNSKHPLNDETRQKILQIAKDMGYTPNLLARGLRKERSFSLGIVVDNIDSIFAPPIIRGVQDTLKPAGYTCLIINSDWDRAQEEASVRELTSRSVDGLIFVDTWLHPANVPADNIAVPCIFVNRIFNSGNSIGPDDRYGARIAVEHLAQLGHRRIAFINGPEGWDASRSRLLGYQDVLRQRGLVSDSSYVMQGDWDIPSGYQAATRLLALSERPTAIFAANDVMALGVIYALQDAGLRAPQDMALIGYDDQDFCSFCNPTLTTVTLPAYELGQKAAETFLKLLDGGADAAKPQLVKGQLVIRESCGDSRGQNTPKTALRASHSPRVVPNMLIRNEESRPVTPANSQKLIPVPLKKVVLNDAFWSPRQETNRAKTIHGIYGKLQELGYIDALKLEWRPGLPKEPHIFWESDLAKWIEAVSYTLATHPDSKLDALLDQVIDLLASAQQRDGYLNAHFTVVEPEKRWTNLRDWHELYCAGHLIEAAVAHYQATGKRSLLDVMRRYADHIDSMFGSEPGKKRGYPGHEEIELALVKLYRATGEERYLRLAQYFVEERGQQPHYYDIEARERGEDPADFWAKTYEYNQSHLPVRQQDRAVGHAVRAMYLYCAVADLVYETGDADLRRVCEQLYESVVERQMFITGGIGPGRHNEGFTRDYDLPNATAYAETCAAIGLFLWMHRMVQLDCDGKYADIMERTLYNGILSGISLDGLHYFYENPLSVDRQNEGFRRKPHHRQSWYGTACCPPNITRLLASLGGYVYSESESDAVVHLYIQGQAELQVAGQTVTLVQESNYPWDGDIKVTLIPGQPAVFGLKLRIPGWCHQATVYVNGEEWSGKPDRGYVRIERRWVAGDAITLSLAMPIERNYAHPKVTADRGRVALQRGPVVYCFEGADNGDDLDQVSLPRTSELHTRFEPALLGGIISVNGRALRVVSNEAIYSDQPVPTEDITLKAIPYCLWDNRTSGDMLVWISES